jgi:hypothetical protein
MPILALLLVLLLPVLALLLMPFTLVQRYRMGSARRRARGWLAALNVFGLAFSNALFLLGAAFTSYWIAGVFTYALLGVAAGGALGVLGLLLTRWEHEQGALHYTPNRRLVLAITLVVAARVAYGFWRAAHGWYSGEEQWIRGAGGTLAAGGLVLGYSFVYSLGVRRRLRAWGLTRDRHLVEPA